MMTKRSNHMPTFTNSMITNSTGMLRRTPLNHSSSGMMTLQVNMIQAAHQKCPVKRTQNMSRSKALGPYQAQKNSTRYEYPTIVEVSSTSFESFSMWSVVTMCSSLNPQRIGISRLMTSATPEKIAPATKYGAKMVLCQPGTCAMAKSQDTTLCTDSTSGVAKAAK